MYIWIFYSSAKSLRRDAERGRERDRDRERERERGVVCLCISRDGLPRFRSPPVSGFLSRRQKQRETPPPSLSLKKK